MINYTFSDNLRSIRVKKGLSQHQLAKKIGISQNTLSEYETNVRYPSLDKVYNMANALNIPIVCLIDAESCRRYLIK